ncbi:hypothetical protein ACT8ZR_09220 [Neobacillus sp. M.A.Huq-85]
MYDKYWYTENEVKIPMVVDLVNQTVSNCASCGWNHEGVEIINDYSGDYFICMMTEAEVKVD